MRVHVDIETRSRVELSKTGVYRYVTDPDFQILMAGWSVDGGPVEMTVGHEETVARFLRYDGATCVAHNAQFERVCFSAALGLRPGYYLEPEWWDDTQARAGELGYPQSLAKLAEALGAEEKDSAGTRLINLFCKPNRKGEWNTPDTHPEQWLDFIMYCEQDVATLVDIDRLLPEWPTESERQVFLADQRINDRGISIDVPLARKAVRVGERNQAQQKDRVRELAGVDNPGSQQQMMEWVRREGLSLGDLQAETVAKALGGTNLTTTQREVLELRQELALAAPKKFAAALDAEVGGRLRGTLKFFGAHTGRWAGRGTQVQNLPRASFATDEETELAIWELMQDFGASAETLKKLVRPMFLGPFTVVDYAAIEARVIAWLAGEAWALEAFHAGRDIYVETADRMGGLSRAEGKVAVLALGFGGGANSLRAMAGEGTMGGHSDDELYRRFVYPWRDANAAIVQMWKTLETRFRTGGTVGPHMRFEKDGNDRLLRLPSGRAICYRKCGVQDGRVTFWSPMGYRQDTYGGRLAENATQAVARDILAESLVRLESAGYHVVAHVHDEIIVDGEHDVETVSKLMCEPPSWATGLPINGEGFTCNRYKK